MSSQKRILQLPLGTGLTKSDVFPLVHMTGATGGTTVQVTIEQVAPVLLSVGSDVTTNKITPISGGTTQINGALKVTGNTEFFSGVKMSGITSGASSNYVLTTDSSGNIYKSPVGTLDKCFGVFTSTVTQVNPSASTIVAMSASTIEHSSGVTVSGGSKFVVASAGTYNLQFSAQLDKTDSGDDDITIWFRKNGSDIPRSSTNLTLAGNTAKLVAAWNYVERMSAGDYLQIMWSSADSSMRLFATSGLTSPTRPDIPSLIVTVNQI